MSNKENNCSQATKLNPRKTFQTTNKTLMLHVQVSILPTFTPSIIPAPA
jgi:hypothetical protein